MYTYTSSILSKQNRLYLYLNQIEKCHNVRRVIQTYQHGYDIHETEAKKRDAMAPNIWW